MAVAAGEQAAVLREKALDLREVAANAEAELATLSQAQLREANERLLIAAVQAQTLAEAAESAAAQMSYMATHDALTGLPNRSLLTDRLGQAITLAQRHGKRVALMYLDLDHFKHTNDSLGHAVGDELLQATARRLQDSVRQSDTVCRQGGDEFLVLLTEVDAARDAALTAEKLVEALAEPYLVGGHRLHLSVSIGVSLYPDDGTDIEALVRNADTAMYHAKRNGRNNYQLFAPEMSVRALARQSVEVKLRQALDRDAFVLHYQPKVNLSTGAIVGAEALVRLQQSGHPLLYPAHFVAVAEDSGLILRLGRWVLSEACRQTAAWLHAGLDVGQVAVNVSAAEFHNKDFVSGVRDVLATTGLDPHYLEFELTESGLMHDTDRTTGTLRALRDLGVALAVDDFGTGFSSLSYLRRFPINTIKIDQSFVQDIGAASGEAILVNAIIAMGRSLKLRVVAEGIETRRQRDYLHAQECGEGQGYWYSRPVDAPAFAALLDTGRD